MKPYHGEIHNPENPDCESDINDDDRCEDKNEKIETSLAPTIDAYFIDCLLVSVMTGCAWCDVGIAGHGFWLPAINRCKKNG